MTPLCRLLVNYTSELPNQWNTKDVSNELKSLKEEIFIKTGKSFKAQLKKMLTVSPTIFVGISMLQNLLTFFFQ